MNTNLFVRFIAVLASALMILSGLTLCFATQVNDETAAETVSEQAEQVEQSVPVLTREQRLKNTIYLQDLNYASAVDGVLTVINPNDKTVMPRMKNDKLYVPLRFVFESVGLEVGWNDERKCVSVWLGETEYRLFTGTSTFALGGFERKLTNDCFIQDGTTYVALEDVTNIITCQTHYFPEYHSAVIAFSEHEWIPERDAEIQAVSAMEFAISPFFKMFT